MTKNKIDCPCFAYEERIAIMLYDGKMTEQDAKKAARQDTCVGCLGALGVGLFDNKKR